MKKIFIVIILISLTSSAYADKLKKSGFLTKNTNYSKEKNITDPKNKIILIYNHGQRTHDGGSSDCLWKNGAANMSSMVGEKINGKELMVYILCTGKLKGDDKRLWNKKKFKPPYKGKPKLEKRLEANIELIDSFVKQGVPSKQIILSGRSCGGWMTMMLIARYPDKVGGGISLVPECYGKLTKNYKVEKVGVEQALENFRKNDGSGPADMRQKQIDEIKNSKSLPILVFTHPKDPFGGLLTDWVEEIPEVKRIIISEDNKVNGKSCKWNGKLIKNYHNMDWADCFQYYNSTILEYIGLRI
tara:strand:+ start:36 stop:938 length:903 start_codon:yes stop_codon:yes gene_type:complete